MFRILAVLCPPLAVLLTGKPSQFATNLALSLLLYLPGLVHALIVVDRHETDRRNEAILRAMERYGV